MELQPPPDEGPYQSIKKALQSLNRHAALQGYAIVKSRSRTYKGLPYRVYIACDRGGRVRKTLVDRLRQGASRQTGCPFQGLFRCENSLWYLELIRTTHNHPPSDPMDLNQALLVDVKGIVSPFGLRLILEQLRALSRTPSPRSSPCTRVFRTTMGLPCTHELGNYRDSGRSLQPEIVHPYWLIERHSTVERISIDPLLLLREPPIARPRGRPTGALGVSRSTRRNPSLFEITETEARAMGI